MDQHGLYQGLVLIGMVVKGLESRIDTAFEGYIDAFLGSMRHSQAHYSGSTLLAYRTDLEHFNRFLNQNLGHSPQLADFNAANSEKFLESESLAGRKYSTLLRRRAVLRAFAAYLKTSGIITVDFFSSNDISLNLPFARTISSYEPQLLTQSELSAINHAMDASQRPRARRDRAILSLMLEIGLPVRKLVELDLADVHPRQDQWYLRLPHRNTWLPVNYSSRHLNRYLSEGRPDLNPLPDEPALFISQTGRRINRQGVWQVLVYWGKASGLKISLSPRLVRNTAVKNFIKQERPLSEINQLLGHTNHLSTRALVRRLKLNQAESTVTHGK